jgi:DnaJ homolog subfamily C member 2
VTESQINTLYRKAALHFHPDKLGRKVTERDKEIWQKIQVAYETLSDPAKRRRYDSSLPFDESIPEDSEITSDKRFYRLFNQAFNNNARFAIIKPVPTLGKEYATITEVD